MKTDIQGGSNMTGTDFCVNKPHMSWSYLNHLVNNTVFSSCSYVSSVGIHINVIFIYQRKHMFQCRLLLLCDDTVISCLNFHLFSIESKDKVMDKLFGKRKLPR